MRLLLVEDSVALADELMPRLKQAGYAVDWLADGRDASRRASDENYDVAVLDLGLPGRNGLEVLHDWRTAGLPLPVLILTARDSFADRIAGLRAGADDYLAKPFHPDELLLRLQALLRRHHGHSNAPRLVVGALALDEERQLVERSGTAVALSGAEFRLLRVFLGHPNRVLSRDQLLDLTRGREADPFDRSIDVQVSRLRHRLSDDPKEPTLIKTVRGEGYVLASEVERED